MELQVNTVKGKQTIFYTFETMQTVPSKEYVPFTEVVPYSHDDKLEQ